jgi:tetratricopeptide (TPR) repeat protein
LYQDDQLDAAEEAVSQSINLLMDKGQQFQVCQGYDLLGDIHHSKGETGKAINHFETALRIASSFNWHTQQFWILHSLVQLFLDEGRFDDAHVHIEHAKSHVTNNPYLLGRVMELEARFWYEQQRFEEAKSKTLCAAEIYEKLGAVKDVEDCRKVLRNIKEKMNNLVVMHFDGELLEMVLLPMPVNSPFLVHGTE